MNQRPQALPVHPGCSWEVFLTFLARPGPAPLMRSQPRVWACLPTYPTEGTRGLPAAHPCVRGFLSPSADQAAGDPPLLSPVTTPLPPGPSCICKAHMLTVCSLVHPVAQGSGVLGGELGSLGCINPDSNWGAFQTGQSRAICPAVLTPPSS